jgi:hypothetical protein
LHGSMVTKITVVIGITHVGVNAITEALAPNVLVTHLVIRLLTAVN